MEWQAVAALADGELIAEKPKSKPNPTVEVRESLPDGTRNSKPCGLICDKAMLPSW